MCANNRNKTQQSVKKKAKIAAQQRKKRIKTTTDKAPGRHSVCRTANSNPKKEFTRPTSRGNCGAEHVSHNKTNKNGCKQKHSTTKPTRISAGCRAELFGQAAGHTLEQPKQPLKQKNTPVGRAKPIQPTKPSENCRTIRGNKQTHRNMHHQEREYRH